MPITFDGEVWAFSTVAEAVDFQRSLAPRRKEPQPDPSQPARPRRRGRPPGKATVRNIITQVPARGRTAINKTPGALSVGSRAVLDAVRRMPPGGLASEEFARAIGVAGPTSIPVKMMVLGKELKMLGLKPEEVVVRNRVYVKGRAKSVFKAGPRLDDALRQPGDLFAVAR